MSVAEFTVTGSLAILSLAGVHELYRIHYCRSSLNVIAQAFAARDSYQSLNLIFSGAYEDVESARSGKRKIGQRIENAVIETLKSPMLRSWTQVTDKELPVAGLRVWVTGPQLENPQRDTEVKIHVCLKSWLEPLFGVLSDRRDCLGQFTSSEQANESRGLSITVSAKRKAAISIPPFFDGEILFKTEIGAVK
jgi:hypothetical protein